MIGFSALIDDFADQATAWTENQQIMFDYVTNTVLPVLRPDGVWYAPAERAPLSFDEVIVVFKAIIKHPNYERQRLDSPDDSGFRVTYDPATKMVMVMQEGTPL